MISNLLERLFGANWRTTLYGGLTATLGTLQFSNYTWVGWMQEVFGADLGGRIEKAVFIGCAIFGVQTVRNMKDKQVSGTGSDVSPHMVKEPLGNGLSVDRPSVVVKPPSETKQP